MIPLLLIIATRHSPHAKLPKILGWLGEFAPGSGEDLTKHFDDLKSSSINLVVRPVCHYDIDL